MMEACRMSSQCRTCGPGPNFFRLLVLATALWQARTAVAAAAGMKLAPPQPAPSRSWSPIGGTAERR